MEGGHLARLPAYLANAGSHRHPRSGACDTLQTDERSSSKEWPLGTRCTLLRPGIVEYGRALSMQRDVADGVRHGASPTIILLQHPPTFTLGARADAANVLARERRLTSRGATVVRTDRGGEVTFHGPGQLVVYPIIDIRRARMGAVTFVRALERVVIDAIADFGVTGERAEGRPGVWVDGAKIAAIGVRISGGVTTHGFALNVQPDLSYFDMIVPCGIRDAAVTSMERITGRRFAMEDVEHAIVGAFRQGLALDVEMRADSRVEVIVGH